VKGLRYGISDTLVLAKRSLLRIPVVGPMLATAIGDAGVPLVERHLVFAYGKRFCDRDPVRRVLVFGCGAHVERAGRHHQHLDATLTIAENVARLGSARRRRGRAG